MTGLADYHMHTPLCRHARGNPIDLAAQAMRLGLPEIGFSDHSPMARDDFDDWRMRDDQLSEYVALVNAARQAFPNLVIRLALEVDYLPGHEEWIRALAARHPWDYLIGSVHYVTDTWDVDNPHRISEWRKRQPDEVWTAYFERLIQAVDSGLFDIVGHADLPKKFGFYPERDFGDWHERLARAAAARKITVELNTAGLRKDCREIYPCRPLLEKLHRHAVPICFGSDAHAPEEVGMNFAEAVSLARAVGYRTRSSFAGRQCAQVPL
jgi:histidinol-phosphatase (PHP family)